MINYKNAQVQADLAELVQQNIPWQLLQNKTVLVTGATGMLTSYVGFLLLYLNETKHLNIRPIFLVRSKEKQREVYGSAINEQDCLVQDVCEPISVQGSVDYIFHAAGAASPYYILNDPVGIINANVRGTQNVLELARFANTMNIVFASTREIYGKVEGKCLINENDMGTLNPLNPRGCYPESKRLAESMFMAYYQQYGINFNSLRIAHSFGPGMQIVGDGRVMSDFMNDAVNGCDIVMKSTGDVERSFCYITDAVSGIFRVLLQGEETQAYNLSNESEPIRLVDLAKLLQRTSGNGKGVKIEIPENQCGYTNYARTALCTKKIEQLGWGPHVSLEDGLKRTMTAFGVFACL